MFPIEIGLFPRFQTAVSKVFIIDEPKSMPACVLISTKKMENKLDAASAMHFRA